MTRLAIDIILDGRYNEVVPKPVNNRPGYDMKYVIEHILNYYYRNKLNNIIEIEREYDTLSVVKPGQSLDAWALSVRTRLQELLAKGKYSVYHHYCLFAGFGNVKMTSPRDYRRPSIHESNMAICFKCWSLVKITEVKPRKEYYSGWRRWVYEVTSKDLMKDHWDNSCSDVKPRLLTTHSTGLERRNELIPPLTPRKRSPPMNRSVPSMPGYSFMRNQIAEVQKNADKEVDLISFD